MDALRDLDDALTMVHLFATLPGEKRLGIPVKVRCATRSTRSSPPAPPSRT